ncbi:unnamed protein product, partial [Arabidopsis halleri]
PIYSFGSSFQRVEIFGKVYGSFYKIQRESLSIFFSVEIEVH